MRSPPVARNVLLLTLCAAPIAVAVAWLSGSLIAALAVEAGAALAGIVSAAQGGDRLREKGPSAAVSSGGLDAIFDLRSPTSARLVLTNDATAPLVIPGVARTRVDGLMLEVVQDGKIVVMAPAFPPGELVESLLAPGGRVEVTIDLRALVAGLPRGPYALRARWDPRPFAKGDGDWRPPQPLDLGSFALIVGAWPGLSDLPEP